MTAASLRRVLGCLLFLLFFCSVNGLLPRSQITLQNNGYSGILIAINEGIRENVTILNNLQEMFTDASSLLYQATKQRAYFKDITILIPKTWSDSYTNVLATTEIFDTANVIVDAQNDYWQDNPYSNQFGPCGKGAEFTHLTERFILDKDWTQYTYGDPARVIVHEWGHLRWGLFDEYATTDTGHFYLNEKRHVEITRCSDRVTGTEYDVKTGDRCNLKPRSGQLPDKYCRFYPDLDNKQKATGSFMFASFLDTVTEFCHSDKSGDKKSLHNAMAPNDQNIQCSYKSSWDVMLESEDFASNSNPPRPGADTTPTFHVVKAAPLRIVLVLDVSGSMSTNNRIGILNQVATRYIKATVPDNNFVGIVEFSSSATITSPLVELQTATDRDNLANLLPTATGGGTCIGCGLNTAVDVLENGGKDARGGILLLITDGQENVDPRIDDVTPGLISKGVFVDTIAFSKNADIKLLDLSTNTNGLSFVYLEDGNSTGLGDALSTTITSRLGSSTDVPIELESISVPITPGSTYHGSTFIDATIGKNTKFFFLWATSQISVIVRRPNGGVIDDSSPEYRLDVPRKSVYVEISGIAEPGEWFYEINGPSQSVEVSIQSGARDGTLPIRVSTSVSDTLVTDIPPSISIYTQVRRGYTPILGADVTATVERPASYPPVDVKLLDNGAGADIKKDDGVYSGMFLDFVNATCPDCRYNIKVTAKGGGGITGVSVTNANSGVLPLRPPAPVEDSNRTVTPIDDFNRVGSGGVIQVPVGVPPGDNFPPSRIIDLRVVDTSYEDKTITLSWTAPGNDLAHGTADEYDLRYSMDFTSFALNFSLGEKLTNDNVTAGDLQSPKPFGSQETMTIRTPETDQNATFFFAVRARDASGNEGTPSNVISSAIVLKSTTVTTPETVSSHPTTNEGRRITASPEEQQQPLSIPFIIGCSLGAAAGAGIVVAVIAAIFYKCAGSKAATKVKEIESGQLPMTDALPPEGKYMVPRHHRVTPLPEVVPTY
ncbi:calcium-activated chloride channel regulator 4A-like [Ptychodera flava]|uniref:calcium-activated chloride channel regulator 4A-like n=1 Tax=Ptychodera flava TaxID=63121 RepID=UPI00396A7BFB